MKRVALTLLSLVVVASLAAASPDSKQTKTVPRDISGALVGTLSWEPDLDVPPGAAPVRSLFDVTGKLTHLGASSMHAEHTPWLDAQGTASNGQFTISAANGDQIWGVYEGTTEAPDPMHMIGHGLFVITGGTGRFAQASGTFEATAFVTVLGPPSLDAVWPVTWVLEGTVSY